MLPSRIIGLPKSLIRAVEFLTEDNLTLLIMGCS